MVTGRLSPQDEALAALLRGLGYNSLHSLGVRWCIGVCWCIGVWAARGPHEHSRRTTKVSTSLGHGQQGMRCTIQLYHTTTGTMPMHRVIDQPNVKKLHEMFPTAVKRSIRAQGAYNHGTKGDSCLWGGRRGAGGIFSSAAQSRTGRRQQKTTDGRSTGSWQAHGSNRQLVRKAPGSVPACVPCLGQRKSGRDGDGVGRGGTAAPSADTQESGKTRGAWCSLGLTGQGLGRLIRHSRASARRLSSSSRSWKRGETNGDCSCAPPQRLPLSRGPFPRTTRWDAFDSTLADYPVHLHPARSP